MLLITYDSKANSLSWVSGGRFSSYYYIMISHASKNMRRAYPRSSGASNRHMY